MPPEDADPPPQHWDEYDAPGESSGSVLLPDTPDPSSTPPPVTPMTPASADPPPSTWVPEPPPQPQPFVPYGNAGPTIGGATFVNLGGVSAGRIGSRWSLIGVILGIAGATVGVGVAIWAASGGGGIGINNPLAKPDMHSQAGIDDLVKSLEGGAGTKVYNLVLYPDYAVAEVAVPGGSGNRYKNYYFDGSLDDESIDGTAPDEATFDVADVDGSLLGGFCQRVEKLVDNPGDCYVIVDPSEVKGDKTFYQAYVSNSFSESAYVTYDADGNEISHYTS